jgi:hypothetical protein
MQNALINDYSFATSGEAGVATNSDGRNTVSVQAQDIIQIEEVYSPIQEIDLRD